MQTWSAPAAAAALSALLRPGERGEDLRLAGCRVLSVSARTEDVLVTFRWQSYPFTLGAGVTQRIPYAMWGGDLSPERWADDALTWLDDELGTGLVARATRLEQDGMIELVPPDRPRDNRFYLDSVGPGGGVAWDAIGCFEAAGFDTTAVRAARADQTLVSWVRAYVDRRRSRPWVGHAAVVRADATTAELLFCESTPGVPGTVALDLCLRAAHEASWQGAERVTTNVEDPLFDAVGFRQVDGRRELSTRFLDIDLEACRQTPESSHPWRPPRTLRSMFSRTAVRVEPARVDGGLSSDDLET